MDDTSPGGPVGPGGGPGSGAVAERMQALLSRAVENEASEQRQVTAVLSELRSLAADVHEQLRGIASAARIDEVGAELATLSTALRTSNHGMSERLDAVSRRLDEQVTSAAEVATSSGAGVEHLGVRLTALSDDVGAQTAALDRVSTALAALSAFPDALAALQGEVSGLHDRLTPLSEVRSGLADLTARTAGTEALRPELAALADRVERLATSEDLLRARDSLSATVLERLERLEGAVARPVVSPDDLTRTVDGLAGRLDEIARSGAAVERIEGLESRLGSLEDTLTAIGERLNDVGDAAGGVPAVATDVGRLVSRMDEVGGLRQELDGLRASVDQVRDADQSSSLTMGLAALRGDVEDLGSRIGEIVVPPVDQVATAVSGQVADRLVDQLAPRVADLVLTRVASTLVEQVADSVTATVQSGLTERVRAATADSERRLTAHVDEAILALAEALLRRRRGVRRESAAPVSGDAPEEPALAAPPAVPTYFADASAGAAAPAPAAEPVADLTQTPAQEAAPEPAIEVVREPVDGPDPVADLGLGDGHPTQTLVGLVAAVQAKEREAAEAQQAGPGQPGADQQDVDQPGAGQQDVDQAGMDRQDLDQSSVDRSGVDHGRFEAELDPSTLAPSELDRPSGQQPAPPVDVPADVLTDLAPPPDDAPEQELAAEPEPPAVATDGGGDLAADLEAERAYGRNVRDEPAAADSRTDLDGSGDTDADLDTGTGPATAGPSRAEVQARAEGAERLRGGLLGLGLDPAEDQLDAGAPAPSLFADNAPATREPARTAPPAVPRVRAQDQPAAAPVDAPAAPAAVQDEDDDDDEYDGRRRPWWRPGG